MLKIVNVEKVNIKKCLYSDSIRYLCIRKEWYTNGTSQEYYKLLDYIDNVKEFTENDFIKIAINIYNHSNIDKLANESCMSNLEFFDCILWEVMNCSNNIINCDKFELDTMGI